MTRPYTAFAYISVSDPVSPFRPGSSAMSAWVPPTGGGFGQAESKAIAAEDVDDLRKPVSVDPPANGRGAR